jgi:hypothetical protein
MTDVQPSPVASSGFSPQTNVVTSVRGTWIVPKVTCSGSGYTTMWVGIDGYNTKYLEQIGTEQDVVNGQANYYAWFEMLPQQGTEQVISALAIHPGDSISATVVLTGRSAAQKTFGLSITDNTTGQSYSTTQTTAAAAPAESAEWIMEVTSENGAVARMANFGTATFSSASATIGGYSGPLGYAGWQNTPINIAGTQFDTTSLIAANGQFSVHYGSCAPATTIPGTTPVWTTAGTTGSLPEVHPAALSPGNLPALPASSHERVGLPKGPSAAGAMTSLFSFGQAPDAYEAAVLGLHKRTDALDSLFADSASW